MNYSPKNGWKSRYDYPEMSNTEKFMGRKLHVQDNSWFMAKIVMTIFVVFVAYLIINGDLSLSGIIGICEYLK